MSEKRPAKASSSQGYWKKGPEERPIGYNDHPRTSKVGGEQGFSSVCLDRHGKNEGNS